MSTRRSIERARRKGAKRGAAMVESLVAFPFFIIVFAGTIFVGQLYKSKLYTIRKAKEVAWAHAMGNCEGSSLASTSVAHEDLDQGAEATKTQGAPGTDIFTTRLLKKASYKVEAEAKADEVIGGFSQKLKTKTTVMCNEKPENGNLMADFLWTYKNMTPWP